MAETNMYGCTPCPKCGSELRVPYQCGRIECDNCGFTERDVPKPGTIVPTEGGADG